MLDLYANEKQVKMLEIRKFVTFVERARIFKYR